MSDCHELRASVGIEAIAFDSDNHVVQVHLTIRKTYQSLWSAFIQSKYQVTFALQLAVAVERKEFVVVHYVCGVFYSCIRCKPIFIRRSPLWLGSWSSYLRVHELRFQMNFLFCGAQAMKSGIKCLKARLNKAVVLFLDLKTCYEHCFERERKNYYIEHWIFFAVF